MMTLRVALNCSSEGNHEALPGCRDEEFPSLVCWMRWTEDRGRERTAFGFGSERSTNYRARKGLQSSEENQDGKFKVDGEKKNRQ
ncbi:hypothetical protein ElyMa_000013600 [Elysia marginata]|uniref:Thyroglobulin type-1 domain-containing protein n=1 Tax=Elysia marginata TaxID=1093978 RepID=A0AAV4EBB6_9GAST|nr:hypothetical protein ElyMa_000013600 [Elysia marginata]